MVRERIIAVVISKLGVRSVVILVGRGASNANGIETALPTDQVLPTGHPTLLSGVVQCNHPSCQ